MAEWCAPSGPQSVVNFIIERDNVSAVLPKLREESKSGHNNENQFKLDAMPL